MLRRNSSVRQGVCRSCGGQPSRMSAMRIGPRPAVHVAPAAAIRPANMLAVTGVGCPSPSSASMYRVLAAGGPPRKPPPPRAASGDYGGGGYYSGSSKLPWNVVVMIIVMVGGACSLNSWLLQQGGMVKGAQKHGKLNKEGMLDAARVHSATVKEGMVEAGLEHSTVIREGVVEGAHITSLPLWIGAVSAAAAVVLMMMWKRGGGGDGSSGAGWVQRGRSSGAQAPK